MTSDWLFCLIKTLKPLNNQITIIEQQKMKINLCLHYLLVFFVFLHKIFCRFTDKYFVIWAQVKMIMNNNKYSVKSQYYVWCVIANTNTYREAQLVNLLQCQPTALIPSTHAIITTPLTQVSLFNTRKYQFNLLLIPLGPTLPSDCSCSCSTSKFYLATEWLDMLYICKEKEEVGSRERLYVTVLTVWWHNAAL